MDPMDKLWIEVDSLKESRIRHDERMKRLEIDHKQLLQHISSVELSVTEMREEIREGFKQMSARISEFDSLKASQEGYDKGRKETQVTMLKQFALWLTIVGLGASFVHWILTR